MSYVISGLKNLLRIIFISRDTERAFVETSKTFTYANIATLCGIAAVFVYLYLYLTETALLLVPVAVIITGLSDVFDGFLARRYSQRTKLGKELDVARDRLLILAVLGDITRFHVPHFLQNDVSAIILITIGLVVLVEAKLEHMDRVLCKDTETRRKVYMPGGIGWGSMRWFAHLSLAIIFVVRTYWPAVLDVPLLGSLVNLFSPISIVYLMLVFSGTALLVYHYRYENYALN